MSGKLFYGDNLSVLREHIADESVDLVYLDPPFNSNATYNVLFNSPDGKGNPAQIEAFDDTWQWSEIAEDAFYQVVRGENTDAAQVLSAIRTFLGQNDLMAYLAMMAVRLIELHRVLRPNGSLYLHCDPTASHYLKVILDSIFGPRRFINEIVWKRQNSKGLAKTRFAKNHDIILRYAKGSKWIWNPQYTEHNQGYVEAFYKYTDESGRRYRLDNLANPSKNRPNLTYEFLGVTRVWRWTRERMEAAYAKGQIVQNKPGQVPALKRYLDEQEGTPVDDIWTDIAPVQALAKERLGYPTQKPLSLLERIINASSNPGDVVLDPFCGCGTTVHSAQKLGRRWIGIDITHIAISLIERRLGDAFGKDVIFETIGVPKDIHAARDLAERDKHEFEKWAISLIPDAQPFRGGKKGADTGIDGIVYMRTEKTKTDKAIIEVKGGSVSVDQIHKLKSVTERESALTGLFLTLNKPTKPMIAEAAAAGFAQTAFGRIPKIQILTIEGLLSHREVPRLPAVDASVFRKASLETKQNQTDLFN